MLRPDRGLELMLMLALLAPDTHRSCAFARSQRQRGDLSRVATVTVYLLVAYLADGREGTAEIPGETPGMG